METSALFAVLAAVLMLALPPLAAPSGYCGPVCSSNGSLARDPTDCTRYTTCTADNQGILVPSPPSSCQPGYFFNDTTGSCAPPEDADYCTDLCNPCQVTCNLPGDVLPDPFNCSLFYVCLEGGKSNLLGIACDHSTPYYNYLTENCTDTDAYCYGLCDPCFPYCVGDGIVADSEDCQGFYMCNPPDAAHFLCPEGSLFDPATAVCSETADCTLNACAGNYSSTDVLDDVVGSDDESTEKPGLFFW